MQYYFSIFQKLHNITITVRTTNTEMATTKTTIIEKNCQHISRLNQSLKSTNQEN